MKRIFYPGLVCSLALSLVACGTAPEKEQPAKPAEPEKPAPPPEIQAAAEEILGSETEVLMWGDLARTGKQQALAINRVKKQPEGAVPGTLITRAAVLEFAGEKWREIFRCDQHLRNEKGYLGGTPVAPVSGWRLQYEQSEEKGLAMYFTPLNAPQRGYLQTIGVRWNPKVGRYQALDRNFENFQGESPALEEVR